MGTRPDTTPASILVADDDDRFRAVVCSVLEDDGYDVVAEAADATSTLALADSTSPEVVVLDLVMKGSVGLSTARSLLAADPNRAVIVISSLFDPATEMEVGRLGAWYLEKAEGVEALERIIDEAVSVSRSRRTIEQA